MNSRELKLLIKADLFRYFGKTGIRNFVKAYFTVPGFRFTYYLRKCSYYRSKNRAYYLCYLLYKIILRHYRYKFGFDISEDTIIGPGLYLGHFGGVVVNPKAVIGNNVSIAQGVTIGKVQRGKRQGVPTIGDNVWIGPHAVIVGNIKVEREALIGPNTFINSDVPEKAVMIGNPAQIISYAGTEDGYATHVSE